MGRREVNPLGSAVRCGIASLVSCALLTPLAAAQVTNTQSTNTQATNPGGERRGDPPGQAMRTVGSEAITSAETLARDPRQQYGKTVMVQAEIDRVLSPHVFLLDEDAAFAGPDILVVVPGGAKDLRDDEEVRVTGTVRPYDRAALERDFDWFDTGDAASLDLRGRPVIVADSVRNAKGGELAGTVLRRPVDSSSEVQPLRVTAGELAEHPDRYLGKRVTVRAEVEDVHNRQLFTLDEDRWFVGPDVIVYARDGRAVVGGEQVVTVTGVVRKFIDTGLFRTAPWFNPWFDDLDAAGRGLVRSRPVIVADSVVGPAGVQLFMPSGQRSETDRTAPEENSVGTGGAAAGNDKLERGQRVTVTGTIESIATDRAFWLVLPERGEPIMVVVDAARMANLPSDWKPAANQRLQVEATVKDVPGQSGQVRVTDWGLPAKDATRFSQQRVYLYADAVTPR